jgi:hypothetical protein
MNKCGGPFFYFVHLIALQLVRDINEIEIYDYNKVLLAFVHT